MAWTIPEGVVFDLVTDRGEWLGCRYVALDGEHLTVERDYCGAFGRTIRLRSQVAVDSIKEIHVHAITAQPETEPIEVPPGAEVIVDG